MQVPNKNYKDATKKRLVGWFLLIFLWALILSVSKSFMQTRRGFLRLDETALRLEKVKVENEDLRTKLETVSSDDHKIKIIRDKLRMQKGDEVVVVMPLEASTIRLDAEETNKPIWGKWVDLLNLE